MTFKETVLKHAKLKNPYFYDCGATFIEGYEEGALKFSSDLMVEYDLKAIQVTNLTKALKECKADFTEADEELHKCRAIVNAKTEHMSVDLEHLMEERKELKESLKLMTGADRDNVALFHQIVAMTKKNELAVKALEFYAEPKNWSQPENSMLYDLVHQSDCADYPHITRDVRSTGGKLARATLLQIKEIK